MNRRALISLALAALLLPAAGVTQSRFLKSYRLGATATSSLPPSNSVSQIVTRDSVLWIGTSKGASMSADAGASWSNFYGNPNFANNGIFALGVINETTWAATGFEKEISDGSVQTGSGYAFSINGGATWAHKPQPIDATWDSIVTYGINDSIWLLPIVVPEQNVTFDISLAPGTLWIASWASGLRRLTDYDSAFQRILLPGDDQNSLSPTDTLWSYRSTDTLQLDRVYRRYDPRRNNNMLAFSVHAIDRDTIWCGTAGGINKSTDGGVSWKRFTHQNQLSGIGGNWVIAIDHQIYRGNMRIWATTWRANDPDEEYGVAYTDDGGISWTNLLQGTKAYDFAFKDSIVYIAADDGIYRTGDGGATFMRFSGITDPLRHHIITSSAAYGAGAIGDTVFVGTGDGLASTIDGGANLFGASWHIYRTAQPVAGDDSYAFPNPFAPSLGVVRIHYSTGEGTGKISIGLFDFAMNRVRTLLHDAPRSPNTEYDEIWDGRDDNGRIVANGVYFYRITRDGSDAHSFGKILAIQ